LAGDELRPPRIDRPAQAVDEDDRVLARMPRSPLFIGEAHAVELDPLEHAGSLFACSPGRERIAAMADAEASAAGGPGGPAQPRDEQQLIAALRRGDEAAFRELVEEHGPFLLRLALMYVSSRSIAEEVVQDTWLA